jgi:2-polyprenyl-3-methyl-5-hydroxy-6-metoxy-1,4-benzoquinol methylase
MDTIHTPGCVGSFEKIYSTTDRNQNLSDEVFHWYRCNSCRLVKINTIPENLSSYYPSTYYNIPTLKQIEKRASNDHFKIDLVTRFLKSGSLLEIGASFGVFALQAKQQGFQVSAIELDAKCCEVMRNEMKINAIQSATPEAAIQEMGAQNAVTIWHVIEHLFNPWEVIQQSCKKLQSGGYLFVVSPNPESFQHRIMKKYWPHTDAPRHLYLLPSKVLIDFAEKNEMELVYQTTNDRFAHQMDRFGWQHLLMNTVRFYPLRVLMYIFGYFLYLAMTIFDRVEGQGSAYTLVLRKKPATSE